MKIKTSVLFLCNIILLILLLSCTSQPTQSKSISTSEELSNDVNAGRMKTGGIYVSAPFEVPSKEREYSMYIRFLSDDRLVCTTLPMPENGTLEGMLTYLKGQLTREEAETSPTICYSSYEIQENIITITPVSKEGDPYSLVILPNQQDEVLALLSENNDSLLFYVYHPFPDTD